MLINFKECILSTFVYFSHLLSLLLILYKFMTINSRVFFCEFEELQHCIFTIRISIHYLFCSILNSICLGHTEKIVTGSADATAKMWNAETGREFMSWTLKAPVRSVSYAYGDKMILTATDA